MFKSVPKYLFSNNNDNILKVPPQILFKKQKVIICICSFESTFMQIILFNCHEN